MKNLIPATDSYKQSHFLQYPPEARIISAYVEARPNPFPTKSSSSASSPCWSTISASRSRPPTSTSAEAICRRAWRAVQPRAG